jgi:hypothetical protein
MTNRERGSASARAASRRGLSQIELGISDGRLKRRARQRLDELALLEVELLHLKLALGCERSPIVVEVLMAHVRGKLRSVLACLKRALKLLLFQKLLLHPLLHLELLETSRVRWRQVRAPSGKPLPQIEVQGILLLPELKLAAM